MKNFWENHSITKFWGIIALFTICLLIAAAFWKASPLEYLVTVLISLIAGYNLARWFVYLEWQRHKNHWQQQAEAEAQEKERRSKLNISDMLKEDYGSLKDALLEYRRNPPRER